VIGETETYRIAITYRTLHSVAHRPNLVSDIAIVLKRDVKLQLTNIGLTKTKKNWKYKPISTGNLVPVFESGRSWQTLRIPRTLAEVTITGSVVTPSARFWCDAVNTRSPSNSTQRSLARDATTLYHSHCHDTPSVLISSGPPTTIAYRQYMWRLKCKNCLIFCGSSDS